MRLIRSKGRRRAVLAVARKLGVSLHRSLVDGTEPHQAQLEGTACDLATKTGDPALLTRQMPEQRDYRSKRLDRSAEKQWLCERKDTLFGECRLI